MFVNLIIFVLFCDIVAYATFALLLVYTIADEEPPPPPPPPPAAAASSLLSSPEEVTVTEAVLVALPPGDPLVDRLNEHVPAEEPAVTVQLCDVVEPPDIVPTVFVPEDTVQTELLLSVAVTDVVEPAVSVPEFCIVAEAVNVPLVATLDVDVVKVGIERSAFELIVICPQSAEHVAPILTQTGCEPSLEGVTEKSRAVD